MNYYNYFTEIEETFVRRRGKNLMLSPLDWALIESWQEREVPLHIILRGIEKVFDTVDKQPARKRSVKSLFYCKEEIEAQYAEWLEMQVGKNGDAVELAAAAPANGQAAKTEAFFSDDAIGAHLGEVKASLEAAARASAGDLRETLKRVLDRLADLDESRETAEKLEETLEKLDALVDECLLQTAPGEARAEIEKELDSYRQKMDREVFARTVELMLLKKLRAETSVPRLSLFYL